MNRALEHPRNVRKAGPLRAGRYVVAPRRKVLTKTPSIFKHILELPVPDHAFGPRVKGAVEAVGAFKHRLRANKAGGGDIHPHLQVVEMLVEDGGVFEHFVELAALGGNPPTCRSAINCARRMFFILELTIFVVKRFFLCDF